MHQNRRTNRYADRHASKQAGRNTHKYTDTERLNIYLIQWIFVGILGFSAYHLERHLDFQEVFQHLQFVLSEKNEDVLLEWMFSNVWSIHSASGFYLDETGFVQDRRCVDPKIVRNQREKAVAGSDDPR